MILVLKQQTGHLLDQPMNVGVLFSKLCCSFQIQRLSKYYGYFGFGTKKYIKPPLELKELPEINLFLLSHNHLDHMSQKTINNFPYKNTKVLVPLKLGKYFTRNGYKKDKVKEMDWFDKVEINEEITITMLPAQHWSKRWIWGMKKAKLSLKEKRKLKREKKKK